MTELTLPKYPTSVALPDTITGRVIVIGDVHGCFHELIQLYRNLGVGYGDYLIFLGDLLDRGPYSNQVVRHVRSQTVLFPENTFVILSNHEEKHLRYERWQRSGKTNPITAKPEFTKVHNEIHTSFWDWMATFPAAITWKDFIFTHAGILPGSIFRDPPKPLSFRQELKGFTRNRWVLYDEETKKFHPVGSWWDHDTKKWCHIERAVHWSSVYQGPEKVVFGHEQFPEVQIANNTYGIDTGCVYGNKLTAMIIDGKSMDITYMSVPALRQYAE